MQKLAQMAGGFDFLVSPRSEGHNGGGLPDSIHKRRKKLRGSTRPTATDVPEAVVPTLDDVDEAVRQLLHDGEQLDSSPRPLEAPERSSARRRKTRSDVQNDSSEEDDEDDDEVAKPTSRSRAKKPKQVAAGWRGGAEGWAGWEEAWPQPEGEPEGPSGPDEEVDRAVQQGGGRRGHQAQGQLGRDLC